MSSEYGDLLQLFQRQLIFIKKFQNLKKMYKKIEFRSDQKALISYIPSKLGWISSTAAWSCNQQPLSAVAKFLPQEILQLILLLLTNFCL